VEANEKDNVEKNTSTEEQIKEAARKVFTRKGFAAARTRDIAEESGHNLALLNYYFRSKEKLFDIIMQEHMQLFIAGVHTIVNSEKTSIEEKITLMVEHYIDMLLQNPDMPLFVLNEINTDPAQFVGNIAAFFKPEETYLARQVMQQMAGRQLPFNPIHIFLNLVSMTIFPFIARPIVKHKLKMNDEAFQQMMEERKRMIPIWVKGMLHELIHTNNDPEKQ